MDVQARQTDRELLPDSITQLLDRHEQRLTARQEAWREHVSTAREFHAAYERMTADLPSAQRKRDIGGLEL